MGHRVMHFPGDHFAFFLALHLVAQSSSLVAPAIRDLLGDDRLSARFAHQPGGDRDHQTDRSKPNIRADPGRLDGLQFRIDDDEYTSLAGQEVAR